MRFGGVPNPRETIVMTRLVGSFGGAVFFGHKKPAERIGGARAVLPRKIFELMGPELVPDCIVAPTHLIVGDLRSISTAAA
jgi:hypothetical protein